MHWSTSTALVLAFHLAQGATAPGQETPVTPAERFQSLMKEYETASGGGAMSDEERVKFIGKVFRRRHELAHKFVELAESHPDHPIALDALIQATWQVNSTPWPVDLVGEDNAAKQALAQIVRDHVRSDRLGPLCQRVSTGFCKEYETLLRAVLERNPHREIRGIACLELARFLQRRMQRVDMARLSAERATEFEGLFGGEYLKELLAQDRGKVTEQIEALLDRAEKEYGEVRIPDGSTVGEGAGKERFEIRHLGVGREAPEIEGEDQDGIRFKLSDYRGKVVLLDFWHQQ